MNLKTAINRITWRLKNGNQNDIDALNCVIDYINTQDSDVVNNNLIFAKLFIYNLNQNINHYKASVFDDIPQKELSRILDMPLERFYLSFKQSLDDNMQKRVFLKNGIEIGTHPATKSESELKDDEMKREYMSDKDVKVILQDNYSLEVVTKKLNTMISTALNRFSLC